MLVLQLSEVCEQHFGCIGDGSLLFPSFDMARLGRDFMIAESTKAGIPLPVRIVQVSITKGGDLVTAIDSSDPPSDHSFLGTIHVVLYPAHAFILAKFFWRVAGMGISSRLAQFWLSLLSKNTVSSMRFGLEAAPDLVESSWRSDEPCFDSAQGKIAKRAIRSRIIELLRHGKLTTPVKIGLDDVYLYPTGMCAIWNAHNVASKAHPTAKSVCFGYVDLCNQNFLVTHL